MRAWLRDEGVPEERVAALRAPAGMDLGAETPEEVAVSILAELVQVRRGRAPFVAMPGPGDPRRDAPQAVPAAPVADDIVLRGPRLRHDRRSRDAPATSPSTRASSTPSAAMGCRTAFIKEPAASTSQQRRGPPAKPDRHSPEASMQFQGTVQIDAPRDRVWAFLMDPDQVGGCGPGVESIEVVDADHFKAKAKVGIGFISARFVVDMTVAERDAPDLAVLKAHGQAPGSRGGRDGRHGASRDPPRGRPRWTGRPTSRSPGRSPRSARASSRARPTR